MSNTVTVTDATFDNDVINSLNHADRSSMQMSLHMVRYAMSSPFVHEHRPYTTILRISYDCFFIPLFCTSH